jgi:hypothetical protein
VEASKEQTWTRYTDELAWAQVRCGKCMMYRGFAPLLGWKFQEASPRLMKATSKGVHGSHSMTEIRCVNCHTSYDISDEEYVRALAPSRMLDKDYHSQSAIYLT